MRKDVQIFLSTLFNPGEHIYASPDKYASVKNEDGSWKIYRPSIEQKDIDQQNTLLVAVNPLKGDTRNDANVTAYRSFLVEMDSLPLPEQLELAKKMGLPYSLAVYSGGKSIHFAIALSEDLPDEETYRFYAEWLLRTIPAADQNTKNPSRSIRFPGVMRPGGKKQGLVRSGPRISHTKLLAYLSKHPDKRPEVRVESDYEPIDNDAKGMALWVKKGLVDGFDFTKGRNVTWFAVGYEFGKCGYSMEDTLKALNPVFTEEKDFKKSEWRATIKNGYKKALKDYRSGKA